MNYYNLIAFLFLPLSVMGQKQFVNFLPEQSGWNQAGKQKELLLSFYTNELFHIQADPVQINDPYLIPTELSLESYDGISICEVSYPEAQPFLLGTKDIIQVFDSLFVIRLLVDIDEALLNEREVYGKLYYQPCDDRKCFFPRELLFEIGLNR